MSLKEYKPGTAFNGVIGRTFDTSEQAWRSQSAPKKALRTSCSLSWMMSALGSLAATAARSRPQHECPGGKRPALQQYAHHGAVLATRSCIMTGRNHHSNAMACITEGSTGFPGSNGNIPFENGLLSEILLENGYNTYAIGKWHLTPADQISAAAV